MGFLDSLLGRKKAEPSRSAVTVTVARDGLTIETRYVSPPGPPESYEWEALSGGSHSPHQMKGIDLFALEPPYLGWLPDDAEGVAELLAELERRGLLGPHEEVYAAWNEALCGILDTTLTETFDPSARDEAARLLAPLRSEPRMALALVELSRGDLDKLREDLPRAETDGADIIYAAWYASAR